MLCEKPFILMTQTFPAKLAGPIPVGAQVQTHDMRLPVYRAILHLSFDQEPRPWGLLILKHVRAFNGVKHSP